MNMPTETGSTGALKLARQVRRIDDERSRLLDSPTREYDLDQEQRNDSARAYLLAVQLADDLYLSDLGRALEEYRESFRD
jgi:hypothetical protein